MTTKLFSDILLARLGHEPGRRAHRGDCSGGYAMSQETPVTTLYIVLPSGEKLELGTTKDTELVTRFLEVDLSKCRQGAWWRTKEEGET